MDFSFVDDSRWFDKTPEVQDVMLDNAFDDRIGSDPRFGTKTPEVQSQMREAFKQDAYKTANNSEFNPINQAGIADRQEGDEGFIGNFLDIATDSGKDAVSAIRLTDDLIAGEFDDNAGKIFSENIARHRGKYVPPELKQARSEVTAIAKEWEASASTWGKTKTVLGAAEDVITNFEGFTYMAGESVSSLALSATGAAAGTIAAGPAGGLAGMFLAGLPVEAQAAFQQEITNELSKRDLAPTEKNINNLIAETDFRQKALKTAHTKALVTSAVDTALGFGIGKVAAKLRPKLSTKAGLYATETASEGVSEAAGQKAAYGEIDTEEVVAEILGGVATSPISTAIDKAAFGGKVVKDVTKNVTANVRLNKDSEVKAAKAIRDTRATHNYQQTVDTVTDIDNYSDPTNKEYSPILAVDILAKEKTPENIQQANDIRNDLEQQIKIKQEKLAPIVEKVNAKQKLTKEENRQANIDQKVEQELSAALETVDATITEMQKVSTEGDVSPTELKVVTESGSPESVQDSIVKSFGSSKAGSDIAATLDIPTVLKRSDLPAEVKTFLTNISDLSKSKQAVSNNAQKSTGQVQQDIFHGSPGKPGIETYHRNIANAVSTGNTIQAQKEYDNLVKFATRHRQKAADHIARKGNDKLSEIITTEADALEKAVTVAQGIIGTNEAEVAPVEKSSRPEITVPTTESPIEEQIAYHKSQLEKLQEQETANVKTEKEESTKTEVEEKTETEVEGKRSVTDDQDVSVKKEEVVDIPPKELTKLEVLQNDLIDIKSEIALYEDIKRCVG